MRRAIQQAEDKPKLLQSHELVDRLKLIAEEQKQPAILDAEFAELVLHSAQEVAVHPPEVAFAMRPSIGVWEYVSINADDLTVLALSIPEYLQFKERLIGGSAKHLKTACHTCRISLLHGPSSHAA